MPRGNPNPCVATRFSSSNRPKPVNLLKDAREVEQLVMAQIREPKIEAIALASLVRSFVGLLDAIRELRGIPKAGQLRPDLDPVQLLKALKRARERKPFELGPSDSASFHEADQVDEKELDKEALTLPNNPPREETKASTHDAEQPQKKESTLPEPTVPTG